MGATADESKAEPSLEDKVLEALNGVLDPEIGLSVVDLDLIREVRITAEAVEVDMLLTTPFCPYGPMLTQQVQNAAEKVANLPGKVTVLPDAWVAPPWLR